MYNYFSFNDTAIITQDLREHDGQVAEILRETATDAKRIIIETIKRYPVNFN